MLTAIGRAAARRVLLSNRAATSPPTQGLLASRLPNAPSLPAAGRALSISAWMRWPAKAPGVKKTKKASTTTTKKGGTKTAAAKKKTKKATTKKAAAPKKKKVKKELTPEEKDKVDLKQLKKMALLKGPTRLPGSLWAVYVANNMGAVQGKLTDRMKVISSGFAQLPKSEKESLRSTAQSNQDSNKLAHQQWVNSHPVEAIYIANLARRRIARKANKPRVYLIHDERLPKRASSPYPLFIKSRFSQAKSQNGDASSKETFRAISEEWRSMSESEKQPFKEAATLESAKSSALFKEIKEKARVYWKNQEGSARRVSL
ncbi:HMG box protein [Metarhizium rileyi]|uniref:HMG box protein n=1 Tax=Metarhizium rileyi (strain RCEF 4871) TaxID=1649241 RepID=A0A167IUL1_METRR|nr:HMG box protein [Metarhizium rileyi RCEF 4871]